MLKVKKENKYYLNQSIYNLKKIPNGSKKQEQEVKNKQLLN